MKKGIATLLLLVLAFLYAANAFALDRVIAAENLNKGRQLMKAKDYTEAIASFKKALELNPRLKSAWRELALCYDITGDYAAARKVQRQLKAVASGREPDLDVISQNKEKTADRADQPGDSAVSETERKKKKEYRDDIRFGITVDSGWSSFGPDGSGASSNGYTLFTEYTLSRMFRLRPQVSYTSALGDLQGVIVDATTMQTQTIKIGVSETFVDASLLLRMVFGSMRLRPYVAFGPVLASYEKFEPKLGEAVSRFDFLRFEGLIGVDVRMGSVIVPLQLRVISGKNQGLGLDGTRSAACAGLAF